MLFPLVWMLITSIELPREAHQFPPVLIPSGFHWQNYPNALEAAPFGRFFINSTIVAVTVVAGNLIFCSLAGYAFARINFAGKNIVFILLLATLMVPFQVTMIPAFLIVKWLGLHVSPLIGIDSSARSSCRASSRSSASSCFGSSSGRFPVELEERPASTGPRGSASCSRSSCRCHCRRCRRSPRSTFLFSWNDFLWPLIVIQTQAHQTVQLGLAYFQGAHVTQWTLLMAGNVMSLIPMLIVFFLAQRYFVRSVATSGLKG